MPTVTDEQPALADSIPPGFVVHSRGSVLRRQGGYTVLDLMARWELSRQVALSLNVANVGSKKYLNSLYWGQAYYGAPRNVAATVQWTY